MLSTYKAFDFSSSSKYRKGYERSGPEQVVDIEETIAAFLETRDLKYIIHVVEDNYELEVTPEYRPLWQSFFTLILESIKSDDFELALTIFNKLIPIFHYYEFILEEIDYIETVIHWLHCDSKYDILIYNHFLEFIKLDGSYIDILQACYLDSLLMNRTYITFDFNTFRYKIRILKYIAINSSIHLSHFKNVVQQLYIDSMSSQNVDLYGKSITSGMIKVFQSVDILYPRPNFDQLYSHTFTCLSSILLAEFILNKFELLFIDNIPKILEIFFSIKSCESITYKESKVLMRIFSYIMRLEPTFERVQYISSVISDIYRNSTMKQEISIINFVNCSLEVIPIEFYENLFLHFIDDSLELMVLNSKNLVNYNIIDYPCFLEICDQEIEKEARWGESDYNNS